MVSDNRIDRVAKNTRKNGVKLMEARRQARNTQAESSARHAGTRWLEETVRHLHKVAERSRKPTRAPRVVFTGPAGCGKTTVAQAFATRLAQLGVIDTPDIVVVNGRQDLIGHVEGQTADNVRRTLCGRRVALIKNFTDITTKAFFPSETGWDPYGDEATAAITEVLIDENSPTVIVLSTREPLDRARQEINRWHTDKAAAAAAAVDEFLAFPGLTSVEAARVTAQLIDRHDGTTVVDRNWSEEHLLAQFLNAELRTVDGRRLLDVLENFHLCRRVSDQVAQLCAARAADASQEGSVKSARIDVVEGFNRATAGLIPYPVTLVDAAQIVAAPDFLR